MTRSPSRTPAEGTPRPPEAPDDSPALTVARGTRRDVGDQAALATRDDEVVSLVHDLRTPLTIILLEAQVLAQRLGPGASEAAVRGLSRIEQNARYLERLMADLLDLASLDAGHFELRLELIDLTRLVADTIDRSVSTNDRARVTVELRDLLYVEGDPVRLERVVANLVGNALKFSVGGSVMVRLEGDGVRARVAVIDDGPGLSPVETPTVFERHKRAGTDPSIHGHGLGLHICRRIVEAHGGSIGVVSTPGQGSRFYFELLEVPAPTPKRRG